MKDLKTRRECREIAEDLSLEQIRKILMKIKNNYELPVSIKNGFEAIIKGKPNDTGRQLWVTKKKHIFLIPRVEKPDSYSIFIGIDKSEIFYSDIKKVLENAINK